MIIHGHAKGSILGLAEALEGVNIQLRWGGSQVPGAINGNVHLLNGLEQLQTLRDARVSIPEFTNTCPHDAHRVMWLGRKLNHTQGKDIITSGRRFKERDFWVKYVPAIAEWRIHILNGKSIARGKKVWVGQGSEPTTIPIIRSRRLGWHLDHTPDPPNHIREAARAAVAAVGYDLGAVDVLDLGGNQACVLEVNSRPAIRDPYTIAQYSKALRNL